MSEPVVLHEVDQAGVATVTLNRPEVNNAYNGDMIQSLLDVVGKFESDDAVRVIVLRGNGRHFQAGADLKWIDQVRKGGEDENEAVSRRTANAVRSLNECSKPTIALVQGGCFGGGIGVIAACDVVIAESKAMFAITEARWGLTAAIILPQLNGAMSLRHVRRYAQSCERFGAARAMEMGLVHEVCEPGSLDETAAPIIDAFLISEPGAMADTKAMALAQAGQIMNSEYFDMLVDGHWRKRVTPEAVEGLASFREKRDPSWYPGTR